MYIWGILKIKEKPQGLSWRNGMEAHIPVAVIIKVQSFLSMLNLCIV